MVHLVVSLEPSKVGDLLEDLVGGLDDLAVELESALRPDQVDQLGHGLDIGALEESLSKQSTTALGRITH